MTKAKIAGGKAVDNIFKIMCLTKTDYAPEEVQRIEREMTALFRRSERDPGVDIDEVKEKVSRIKSISYCLSDTLNGPSEIPEGTIKDMIELIEGEADAALAALGEV